MALESLENAVFPEKTDMVQIKHAHIDSGLISNLLILPLFHPVVHHRFYMDHDFLLQEQ